MPNVATLHFFGWLGSNTPMKMASRSCAEATSDHPKSTQLSGTQPMVITSTSWDTTTVFHGYIILSYVCMYIYTEISQYNNISIHIYIYIRLLLWLFYSILSTTLLLTSLVGGWATPLKNMKVKWEYHSQYMESHKSQVSNHQSVIYLYVHNWG